MKPASPYCSRAALAAFGLLAASNAATAANFSGLWLLGQDVPDNSIIGLTDVRTVNSEVTNILGVTVTLNISGGWAGDLYAYVVHDSGFAVLLNRPGRTAANTSGNPASGLQVTFEDSAATDIHLAPSVSGVLAGTLQPDGRTADPAVVTGTSPRTAMLNSFNGLPASGVWSLYIADVSAGGEAVVQSWGLQITGIPEPSAAFLLIGGSFLLARRRRTMEKQPVSPERAVVFS